MPLMHGKSQKAFSKNVSTEMHHGKPQKQALAIAYAVKRRAGKKMAKGGMVPHEDMSREHDPIVTQHSEDNEDLHPQREPEHGAERMMHSQMHLASHAQSHEDLEESKIDPGSLHAYRKQSRVRMEPKMAQIDLSRAEQGAHFSHGGIAKAIMHKRMAKGGMTHYPTPQDPHYVDGGMVDERAEQRDAEHQAMKQQAITLGAHEMEAEKSKRDAESEAIRAREAEREQESEAMGSHYAYGGMHGYAEGGPVDEMGLNDQEYDTDRFMAEHMEPSHYDHLTAEDESDMVAEMEPKEKRKKMLSSIMMGLHAKHMGK